LNIIVRCWISTGYAPLCVIFLKKIPTCLKLMDDLGVPCYICIWVVGLHANN